MVYKTFQEAITSRLQERLGGGFQLLLQQVPKNNGLVLNGLSISPKGGAIAPTIYLEHYYHRFLEGAALETLVDEILDLYNENSDILRTDFSVLKDFSRVKDRVAYRLINAQANRGLLEDVPHIPYLDLAIVFYLFLDRNPIGQITALIRNRHMKAWNTTEKELYALASRNTPTLLPPDLRSMAQVMKDIAKEHLGERYREDLIDRLLSHEDISPLYVLTNTSGLHGASAILYPGELKNFANTLNRDLVILPSSIHEVLLVPYDDDVLFNELSGMVTTINKEEVSLEDRLSNHVYFYSRTSDEAIIAYDPVTAYVS